jgi:ApbE superfamily uncharacterized protein (UPF0280 family)
MGNADAVTVVSEDVPLADAWATALANEIKRCEDIDRVMDKVKKIPEILGCMAIMGEKMGVRGDFELKLLSWDP